MKIFDWISKKKPKKNHQAEAPPVPNSQQENAEIHHHHHSRRQQQQQQQNQSTSSLLHAVLQNKLQRLNQSRPAFGLNEESKNSTSSRRREVVKIFVNHEEYGLLAIGTLGLYDSAGVEPEIELFEVRPNLSLQPDGVKVKNRVEISDEQGEEQAAAPQSVEDQCQKAVVLHSKQQIENKKKKLHKVFPLDPHIGAASGLLRRSKFLDRLLQPLNYLRPSSNITILPEISEEQQQQHRPDESQKKPKSKAMSLLFKKLLLTGTQAPAPSSMKQIKCDNESSSSSSIGNRYPSKLKRLAMSQFSACVGSPEIGNDDEEEEEEDDGDDDNDPDADQKASDQKEFAGGASGKAEAASSLSDCPEGDPNSSFSATREGDPSQSHQQTCAAAATAAQDLKAEYWIRTDSDYVVLEL